MDRLIRRDMPLPALALLIVALSSISANAQDVVAGQWISVKIGPAAVMLYPSATSVVVGTAPVGMRLQVHEIRNGWYFVTLPKDPDERAARWGWLPAAVVGPSAAPTPSPGAPGGGSLALPRSALDETGDAGLPSTLTNLRALRDRIDRAVHALEGVADARALLDRRDRIDQAIRALEGVSDASPSAPVPPNVPARDRQTTPRPQTASHDWMHRIFIGVNGGSAQPGSVTFTDTRADPFFGETTSWTAGYKVKSGSSLDVGAGVRVWRNVIAGVEVSRFEDKTPATLTGTVPHPFFFNQPRDLGGESQRLKYTEQAVHVSAAWMLPAPRWLQLTVFGGPTVFSVSRDLVEDIEYSDSYPYDAATFTSASIRSVRLTKTGFHAGGDISWFFTDRIGVGAVVRFARAQAKFTSPANNGPLSAELGGLQAGGGVRLRLGRRRP